MISQLLEEDVQLDLEKLCKDYFEETVTLTITPIDNEKKDTPKSLVQNRQEQETDRMRRLREDALSHPALKSVQEIFGGEIKKIIPIDKGFV